MIELTNANTPSTLNICVQSRNSITVGASDHVYLNF